VTNRLPPIEQAEPLETDESGGVYVVVEYFGHPTLEEFGPFQDRELAEECVLVLAAKACVMNATIREEDWKEGAIGE
jgi:hypothetical protein